MERRVKYALKARFSVSALMGFMVNYATRMPTCVSWAFVKTMLNAPMATAPIILAYVLGDRCKDFCSNNSTCKVSGLGSFKALKH